MKCLLGLGLSLLAAIPTFAQNQSGGPANLPSEPIPVFVNVIPAKTQYVIYANLGAQHRAMRPEEAAATGKNLMPVIAQLRQLGKQRGANLLVLLGSEHGISVPVNGLSDPLTLRPDNASFTALLLRWTGGPKATPLEQLIRFTTAPVPADKDLPITSKLKKITFSIGLQSAPPGAPLAQWVYMNIPRCISQAVQYQFDTISIASTTDPLFEAVWLPGCDEPLKVSRSKPQLAITIFKRPKPDSN